MKDAFEATLIVDLAPAEVWQALTRRTIGRDGNDSEKHYVLPGFPSIPPLEIEGASCTVLEEQPERLLIVKKDKLTEGLADIASFGDSMQLRGNCDEEAELEGGHDWCVAVAI